MTASARDEPLFEISTDKVDSELPSPAAGVLTEILVHEGDTVEVGARVAVIGESIAATPGPPSRRRRRPPSAAGEPHAPAPAAPAAPHAEPSTGEGTPQRPGAWTPR